MQPWKDDKLSHFAGDVTAPQHIWSFLVTALGKIGSPQMSAFAPVVARKHRSEGYERTSG
jgi:hypothetical protein